ncbi:MAG TPA: hypothetical protein VLA79_16230 [Polyangia bacterium]|nr:hypothetical protein [Polyangia bacterium]
MIAIDRRFCVSFMGTSCNDALRLRLDRPFGDTLKSLLALAREAAKADRVRAHAARQPMPRYRQPPRVQARSSRSRGCAAKHPDGYRDTVYRQMA